MADMLDYIDKLEELDTSGIEHMSHVFPVNNVFRDDVVTNGDGSEVIFSSFAFIEAMAAFTASSTVTSFACIFLPSSTAVKDIKSIFLLLNRRRGCT